MNRELKRISGVVLMMFAALFVASSAIQVFQADNLHTDSRNARTAYESYEYRRGQILLADGKAVVRSVKSKDEYQWQRTYVQPKLYAPVTGFFPINGEPTGIEGALDKELAGTSSDQFFDRLKRTITGQDPQGDSVQLTIEPKVQKAAYDALGDKRGAVVALNPKTGDVLALVSKPSFDPNPLAKHYGKAVDTAYQRLLAAKPSPLVNRAIGGDLNPPALTFKLVTSSAALESGKYTAKSTFPSPDSLVLPGTSLRIRNSYGEPCGSGPRATLLTALSLSCNIPFAELGIQLGNKAIKEQAEKFGFNKRLSIPLRVTPSVYPTTSDPAQTAQTAFGQFDDRATPMQMAMVSAAIGNGGVLMKPNLVQKVLSPSLDTVSQMTPAELARPVSTNTADTVRSMMVASVSSGAATNARMDGVTVAGKTGTAQNGENDPYTLWFTGFAPAEDPKVAVAVVIENGGGLGQSGYGNLLAAPIAKRVFEAVLNK